MAFYSETKITRRERIIFFFKPVNILIQISKRFYRMVIDNVKTEKIYTIIHMIHLEELVIIYSSWSFTTQ